MDSALSSFLPDLIKKKSINLDVAEDDIDDKKEHSKKKQKKSKSERKSKHRDRSQERNRERNRSCERSRNRSRSRDRGRGSSREKAKHSKDVVDLTPAEKFSMFKKQRESAKGDVKEVDDLFKDFLASKRKDSVDEINKMLDSEINNLIVPHSQGLSQVNVWKNYSQSVSKDSNDVVKTDSSSKVCKIPEQTGPIPEMKEPKIERDLTDNKGNIAISNKISLHKTDIINKIKSAHIETKCSEIKSATNSTAEDRKSPTVFKPLLPRSVALTEKQDSNEDSKVAVKKPPAGFKNFGIKLSSISKELIESGEIHKKGKRLEEGEVLSSNSENSSESEAEENEEEENGDISETGSLSDSDPGTKVGGTSKKKKKKKKKAKHKKKKKSKEKDKDHESTAIVTDDGASSKRKTSNNSRSRSRSPKRTKRSRSKSKERSRKRSRSTSRFRSKKSDSRMSRSRSRRSLSKSRSRRSRSHGRRSRSKGRKSRSRSRERRERRSHSRSRRSRSKDRRRSRSKERRRSKSKERKRSKSKERRRSISKERRKSKSKSPDRFWRSKYGDFDAYKYLKRSSRSRSKTPERERERFIEKEKKRVEDLRCKIDKAKLREIAIKNALSNAKSGGPHIDVTFKAGGKSVEELTEYCKRIQEQENSRRKFRDDSSSSEDDRHSDDEDNLHHPFKVKEAAPIIMDIKNSKQLPVVSPQERLVQSSQLRLQFPVSSGSQHREKEWVPVEPTPPAPALPPGKPKAAVAAASTSFPALPAPGVKAAPAVPEVKAEMKVFEEPPAAPIDITAIVSERLNAVRKLAENPHDMSAQLVLNKAQEQAKQWARSKNLPGQFVGSTGANIMSQEEIIGDKKKQAWLRKAFYCSNMTKNTVAEVC